MQTILLLIKSFIHSNIFPNPLKFVFDIQIANKNVILFGKHMPKIANQFLGREL